ncbi:hypothetical protein LEP3755_12060 [Leptolyngbya sp. NIES-3755]|nr:hypothetical protein LEP3755_12060 [Leptolyngbya sp. NIES-3755]
MNTEQYATKKPAQPPLQDGFESRPFAAQMKVTEETRPLEAQLDRAERFGHSLDRVQVLANPVQAKVIQREEGEEEEMQMKADPIQREEGEEEELAM